MKLGELIAFGGLRFTPPGGNNPGEEPVLFSFSVEDPNGFTAATFSRGGFATYTANSPILFGYSVEDSLAGGTHARAGAGVYHGIEADELAAAPGIATILAVNGQSNAVSFGTVDQTPPANIQEIDPERVLIWNGAAFVGYVAGSTSEPNGVYPNAWGPEAEFARLWCAANPGEILYIVKYAYAATQLQPDGSASLDWHPDSIGEHFEGMAAFMADAQAWLIAQNKTPDVIANLWMQGERDADIEAAALAYEDNLTDLVAESRTRWLMTDAKWIIVRITYAGTYMDDVRDAEDAVAAADATVYIINADAYATDGVHYTPDGVVAMGADAYAVHAGSYVYTP